MGFSNEPSSLVDACVPAVQFGSRHSIALFSRLFLRTMEFGAKFIYTYHYKEGEILLVKFFQSRPPFLQSTLAKIRCPVRLIYFGGDIVYTSDEINILETNLKAAGVDAQILKIPGGCHYGSTIGGSKECVLVLSSHPPY